MKNLEVIHLEGKCQIYLKIEGKEFILAPDRAAEIVFKMESALSSFNTWEYLNHHTTPKKN